jgi:hypothetical protein
LEVFDEFVFDCAEELEVSKISIVFDRLVDGFGGGARRVGLNDLWGDREVPRADQQRWLQLDHRREGKPFAVGV